MDNMRIYNAGREVPQEAQKQFNNGRFSGTDINPMWRIKKLTELFGPCGIGWYVDDVEERWERVADDTIIAIVNLKLYVRDGDGWSKPIYGTGGNTLLAKGRPSDEGYKMAYTDALSVACKALGIGANVYFDKDKTKYTAVQQPAEKPQSIGPELISPGQVKYIRGVCDEAQVAALIAKYKLARLEDMPRTAASKIIEKLQERSNSNG